MTNFIGHSLGRYHLLEQIGEGGMATVYKAYDTRLEREVAVKVIRRESFPAEHHARIFKRFEREARALGKLSHPHIVSVIEYGEHEGAPYLVMELIPGGTLKGRLGKPIAWTEAVARILPVARALDYAHRHGIVHRDVKPSNILLTETGEPMLTDFGIVKVLEAGEGQTLSTTTGVGIGTPEYMAPEQGLGQEVDARADIYSLGIVLYELITGKKPFRADTPMAVIVKQVNDPLPRPRQFVREIPNGVERVLFKALAKKPDDRYRSMEKFGKALDGLLEPVRAREKANAGRDAARAARREVKQTISVATPQGSSNPFKSRRSMWLLTLSLVLLSAVVIALTSKRDQPLLSTFLPTTTATTTLTVASTASLTATPTTATPTLMIPHPLHVTGDVLFAADFESSGIEGYTFHEWSASSEASGDPSKYWMIEQDVNENHYLVADVPVGYEATFEVGTKEWSNYVVEARIKVERLPAHGQGASVLLRSSGPGPQECANGYEFAFGRWLYIYNDCAGGHLVTAYTGVIKENDWFHARIELYKDDIREYVSGKPIYHIFDDTSLNGNIWFGAGNGSKVSFDDILVMELEEREAQ